MTNFTNVSKTLLEKFGFSVDLYNFNDNDFDIETGETVRSIYEEANALAVFTQFESGAMKESGYVYEDGDKQILLNVDPTFIIEAGTSLLIDGIYYKIAFMSEVKDKLETVVYKLIIREDFDFIEPEV